MNYTMNSKPVIIGIDHGYGNIKTAHTCFRTGVTVYDKEPRQHQNGPHLFQDRRDRLREGAYLQERSSDL